MNEIKGATLPCDMWLGHVRVLFEQCRRCPACIILLECFDLAIRADIRDVLW